MDRQMIAIPQPELPNPLPTDQQELMNCFYKPWQALEAEVYAKNKAAGNAILRTPTREEMARTMPPKVNAAVMMGNHSYQVHNGGFRQWDDNGYSDSVLGLRALYEGAASVGIEHAQTLVDLLDTFMRRKQEAENGSDAYRFGVMFRSGDDDEDDCEMAVNYDDLDTRLYDLPMNDIMQAVLDRFEDVVGYAFMAGSFRRAA